MVVVNYKAVNSGLPLMKELKLKNVHPPDQCQIGEREHCVIHRPSNHHMLDWPASFESTTGLILRACEHGYWHPDPDSLAWLNTTRPWMVSAGQHSCDSCCKT